MAESAGVQLLAMGLCYAVRRGKVWEECIVVSVGRCGKT